MRLSEPHQKHVTLAQRLASQAAPKGRSPTSPLIPLELHLRGLVEGLAVFGGLVHGGALEAEHARHDVAREHLAGVVQFAGGGIEEAAGGGKLVLDVGQFVLQLQEVLVGLQFGVGFQRHAESGKSARQGLVGGKFLVDGGGVHGGGSGGSHLFESFLFVGSIPLDGLHQLGHQVIALLELHIDIGKGVFAVVAEFHQAIVHGDESNNKNNHHNGHNDSDSHKFSFCLLLKGNVYNFYDFGRKVA